MSIIHIQQIRAHLEATYDSFVPTDDVRNAPAEHKSKTILTRSLAAFAIGQFADVDPAIAGPSVTDGTGDNGIDAIYFDAAERLLYVVQSKWHSDGSGSIDRGDGQKFIQGVKDLVNSRFDRFNARMNEKRDDVIRALSDANLRIVLVVIHTGTHQLAGEVTRDFDDLLAEMNDPSNVMTLRVLKQLEVYATIQQGARGAPINLDIVMYEWGQVREPYQAFYGQVAAEDVADWYNKHHPRLFAPNLRVFLGSTDVNESIVDTIKTNPNKFWYFNNGITALATSVRRKTIGGTSRDSGTFECENVSIVNGAQTVGTVASVISQLKGDANGARVPFRIISLERCPPEIAVEITRATNTQNRIDRRDFVALDQQQQRLADELRLDKIEYMYKSGETVQSRDNGFDLVEATIALACSHSDIAMAVQAKREIGKLWEDINKAPYRSLFNASLNGRRVWRLVQIQRYIDRVLPEVHENLLGRDSMVTVHGNRFVAHEIFLRLTLSAIDAEVFDVGAVGQQVGLLATDVVTKTIEAINKSFADNYLASLFKNLAKCEELDKSMNSAP